MPSAESDAARDRVRDTSLEHGLAPKETRMSNNDTAIKQAIESFVEQLRGLIQAAALEAVQAALTGAAEPGRRRSKPGRVASATPGERKKGSKRTPEELEALVKQLHSHIIKNPGQRIEQISKTLGVSTKEFVLPIKKLVSEKKISTKGAKRATTYFAK